MNTETHQFCARTWGIYPEIRVVIFIYYGNTY